MASMWITRAVVVASVGLFICLSKSKTHATISGLDGLSDVEKTPVQPEPAPNQPASAPIQQVLLSNRRCGGFKFVSDESSTPSITDWFDFSPLKELGGTAALHNSATDLGSSTHRCGASLISDRFLITSAHCVTGTGSDRIISVSLGREDLDENPSPGPDIYEVEEIIIHPDYGLTNEYNDIAILKTNRKVRFSKKIWPFCLPERNQVFTGLVQIAGWGDGAESKTIHSAFVRVLSHLRCSLKWLQEAPDIYRNITQITYPQGLTDQIMCGGRDGVDACPGDDGGPMSHQNSDDHHIVIGVIAKRTSCPDYPTTPGFYTNVAYYTDWIYDTTGIPRPSGLAGLVAGFV